MEMEHYINLIYTQNTNSLAILDLISQIQMSWVLLVFMTT